MTSYQLTVNVSIMHLMFFWICEIASSRFAFHLLTFLPRPENQHNRCHSESRKILLMPVIRGAIIRIKAINFRTFRRLG